jgi:hypothetical protein
MGCIKYRKLISKYIDNEISNLESEALFQHLEECDECSLEMKNQSILSSYIKETYNEQEQEIEKINLSSSIMAQINFQSMDTKPKVRSLRLIKFLKPISVAASVALVSSVIYFSMDSNSQSQKIAKSKITVDTENIEQLVLEHMNTNAVAENYTSEISLVSYK